MNQNETGRRTRAGASVPFPINQVSLVLPTGLKRLSVEEITNLSVGWKAFGLSTLPTDWLPPFFVISSDCGGCIDGSDAEKTVVAAIARAVSELQLAAGSSVFVRSSGTTETLDDRGQLDSQECSIENVWQQAKQLLQRFSSEGRQANGQVHLVVQRGIAIAAKGHLANERRLSREPRDWVAEFEPAGGQQGHMESVAIRHWRSGKLEDGTQLKCQARTAIGIVLKRVGSWAMQFATRLHFEWVWDGDTIWLVQADTAHPAKGIDPRTAIPQSIPKLMAEGLKVFSAVSDEDFATYGKLRNARVYSEIGYQMPPFYVLDQQDVIEQILGGTISDDLASDLSVLTQRPFIIRTDGRAIPAEKKEMLPRSDELRSLDDAKDWLTAIFPDLIAKADLAKAGLCLIAHHFIPSVASAWARAEPANPIVRIESLWGIPEGLYWHSHDTFEVDTGARSLDSDGLVAKLDFKLRERLRFKGTFVAADSEGHWVPQETDENHDWARSITRTQWIFEIARTTRLIAEKMQHPVSVMWFVDNHPQATCHKVLPWFHSRSSLEGGLKAAPRRKRNSVRDVVIRNVNDWESLKNSLSEGRLVERVVMAPIDTALIRNQGFASDLAQLAKDVGFVVELSGGILSHAYYMLSSQGCRVECVDLFGAGEDVLEFHKLVRDKIPEIIRDRGERVESVELKGDALILSLRQKLVEEAFEALDAGSGDELLGELADVQEVLIALASALNIDQVTLEQERMRKRRKRGGFDGGLMLLKTASPQSISPPDGKGQVADSLEMDDASMHNVPSISDPMAVPARAAYRRPDLRNVGRSVEKLFTFKTDIETLQEFEQRLEFEMPVPQAGNNLFALTVELDRERARVRGKIRLQVGPSQLELPFE